MAARRFCLDARASASPFVSGGTAARMRTTASPRLCSQQNPTTSRLMVGERTGDTGGGGEAKGTWGGQQGPSMSALGEPHVPRVAVPKLVVARVVWVLAGTEEHVCVMGGHGAKGDDEDDAQAHREPDRCCTARRGRCSVSGVPPWAARARGAPDSQAPMPEARRGTGRRKESILTRSVRSSKWLFTHERMGTSGQTTV